MHDRAEHPDTACRGFGDIYLSVLLEEPELVIVWDLADIQEFRIGHYTVGEHFIDSEAGAPFQEDVPSSVGGCPVAGAGRMVTVPDTCIGADMSAGAAWGVTTGVVVAGVVAETSAFPALSLGAETGVTLVRTYRDAMTPAAARKTGALKAPRWLTVLMIMVTAA